MPRILITIVSVLVLQFGGNPAVAAGSSHFDELTAVLTQRAADLSHQVKAERRLQKKIEKGLTKLEESNPGAVLAHNLRAVKKLARLAERHFGDDDELLGEFETALCSVRVRLMLCREALACELAGEGGRKRRSLTRRTRGADAAIRASRSEGSFAKAIGRLAKAERLTRGADTSALEAEPPAYDNTFFLAPTWDATAAYEEEVPTSVLRSGLEALRDAFGSRAVHGPYARPGITLYCQYEGPLEYDLQKDVNLMRALELTIEVGLPYRLILHGGQFTGTDCVEEPLQCFLKKTAPEWLLGDPGPYTEPEEGADTPPYVTFSRYNSVYYVRKMRNLRSAVHQILDWIAAEDERRRLFIGFSKDPETVLPPHKGITTDPLTLLEFGAWRSRDDIYFEGILTIPMDHHPGATGVSAVEIELAKGAVKLGPGLFSLIGYEHDTPRRLEFGLVLVDEVEIGHAVAEFTPVLYTVKGGDHDGMTFASVIWRHSDDPEGDGGEWMVTGTGEAARDLDHFMRALVDHHVEDVLKIIHSAMVESGFFKSAEEARRYLYSHEVPGGVWSRTGPGYDASDEPDYDLLEGFMAPLVPDPSGNWTSVAASAHASPGIDVFGPLTLDREILDAAELASNALGGSGNWAILEWNPGTEDVDTWETSLEICAEYGVHILSLQGWEEIQDAKNNAAQRAMSEFLVRMGCRPYRPGADNR